MQLPDRLAKSSLHPVAVLLVSVRPQNNPLLQDRYAYYSKDSTKMFIYLLGY